MMKFKHYLQEDYVSSITGDWTGKMIEGPIFVNPSVKEIMELKDEEYVRFILNFKTKQIFIWPGGIIHNEASELLYKLKLVPSGDMGDKNFWRTCFAGTAVIIGGRLHYSSASEWLYDDPEFIEKALWVNEKNTTWVEKWIKDFYKSIAKDLNFYITFRLEKGKYA